MKAGIRCGAYPSPNWMAELKADGYQALNEAGFASLKSPLYLISDREVEQRMVQRRQELAEVGLYVNQTHGPCPTDDNSEASRNANFALTLRAMRGTVWVGATDIVLHPLMPKTPEFADEPEKVLELNREWFLRLLPYAHDMGIRLNVENMPYAGLQIAHMQTLLELVRQIDDPALGVCLDTGHCTSVGDDLPAVTRACKEKLYTTHVHDNDLKQDQHMIPFTGRIDWNAFRQALTEIGFDGVVSLECNMPRNLPDALLRDVQRLAARGALWISGQLD